MIYLEDLLLTEAVHVYGMNESDILKEIDLMIARNKAITDFYKCIEEGSLSCSFLDEFWDVLNENFIDPYGWLDQVSKNILLSMEDSH